MTDHHDSTHPSDPTPPSDPIGASDTTDAADARWFREAVAPVVDARPVPDAWDTIRARATGEGPTVVALSAAPGRGRSDGRGGPRLPAGRRTMALVAAALLAVVGIGTTVVVRDKADKGQVVTATPTPTPADVAPGDATGWYIPRGLPTGWELESVATDWLHIEGRGGTCPCHATVWRSEAGSMVLSTATFDGTLATQYEGADMVELGNGIIGVRHGARYGAAADTIGWVEGTRASILWYHGLQPSEALAQAKLLAPGGDAGPKFTKVTSQEVPAEVRAFRSVLVTLRHTPSGRTVAYGLQPPGLSLDPYYHPGALGGDIIGGQPVGRFEVAPDGGASKSVYVVKWPGVDVIVGRYVEPLPPEPMADADLRMLVPALRPATTEEWYAFLDSATGNVSSEARTATLADLMVSKDGDAANRGTSTTVTSPLISNPGGLSPQRTAALALKPQSGRAAAGQPLTVSIEVTNDGAGPIALTPCTWAFTQDRPTLDEMNPQRTGELNRGPCDSTSASSIKRDYVFPTDGVAPGRYWANVHFPDGQALGPQALVLPKQCAGVDVTDDYAFLSEPDAKANAMRTHAAFRVVWRDGTSANLTEDVRPDRVNVMVENGKVIGACTF
ncbi:MAG: hypothetical protein ABIP03_09470 [Aquihabitans sp.]